MQEQELEYAGFWVRTGATIVDTILLLMITVPLTVTFYGWEYFTDQSSNSIIAGPADFLISWVFPLIAVILFWVYKQATPGKMLVSAKIVDAATGNPPSVAQSIGRYFAYILSTLPLFLGFIWVGFDKKKQGWHDKLAGTVVVREVRSGVEPVKFG